MKKLLLLTVVTFFFIIACSSDDNLTQEQEADALSELLSDIQALAKSVACTDLEDVSLVALGSKACGGPAAYMAYSLNIDVDQFLAQVKDYTEMEREFNTKWGVISDCAVENPPAELICDKGVPRIVE